MFIDSMKSIKSTFNYNYIVVKRKYYYYIKILVYMMKNYPNGL